MSGRQRDDAADTQRGGRPKLEDVAAHVGLSVASVSLVLNNSPGPSERTRERVLHAAAELGYRPDRTASLLARRRSHLLGVMMEIRSTFHAELVEDIHTIAEQVGYDVVLSATTRDRSEQRAIESLLDFRCEGLLLLGPDTPASRLAALARRVPVVAVGRRIDGADIDVVRSADHKGVRQAVDHLVELGHRDIAYVDGGRGTIAADRRRGYRDAMRAHDLGDNAWVLPGDHTEESGTRAARRMLSEGHVPTAVVAFNDRCALGLYDAFTRAGLDVPGGVSVVGYDDSPLSRLAHIDLTTVSQSTRDQAERAVAAAVQRLDEGRTEPTRVVLTPRLVARATTAAPSRR